MNEPAGANIVVAWVAVVERAAKAPPAAMAQPHWARNACIHAGLHVEVYEPKDAGPLTASGRENVTVVLCHGFGGSARNFRPQARALSTTVRFVLYDARGHARSEKPTSDHAYDMECLVDDLAAVVRDRSVGRVVVGGLSLGAAVALRYVLRRQSPVAGLLLSAYPDDSPRARDWAVQFAESIEKFGIDQAGERFVWGEGSRFDQKARELIKSGFREHAPWALSALLRRCLGDLRSVDDMADELRDIRIPTRVVVGGADHGSLGPCQSLSSLIPGATLTVLEGAGHVVNLARVAEFNEELQVLVGQASGDR